MLIQNKLYRDKNPERLMENVYDSVSKSSMKKKSKESERASSNIEDEVEEQERVEFTSPFTAEELAIVEFQALIFIMATIVIGSRERRESL